MKAITKYKFGGPEVLQIEEVDQPKLAKGQILVEVKANSANAADWRIIRGKPFLARFAFGLLKPKYPIAGCDFSGIVCETGDNVTHFKKGDYVFGESLLGGAFADYVAVTEQTCGKMSNDDFVNFACLPMAATTAFQALITQGKLKSGESVLINGASGGVGHFAVQIAKTYGASVTAVCSSKNSEFVKSLGADHVIAYDKESMFSHKGKYDLVIDNHGNLRHQDYKRMGKRGVMVGFTGMGKMFSIMLLRAFSKFSLTQFTAKTNTKDLELLADLISENKIKTQVEKTYSYSEIPQAIADIETVRTKGKLAIKWKD